MTRLTYKERILTAIREKQVFTYKGAPIRLPSDFSIEIFQARRVRCEIFKVMKVRTYNQGYFTHQGYHLKSKGE